MVMALIYAGIYYWRIKPALVATSLLASLNSQITFDVSTPVYDKILAKIKERKSVPALKNAFSPFK